MDVAAAAGVARRRWLAILVCLVAGITGALALTRSTEKVYRSEARLFVNIPAAAGVQEALQGVQLSSSLLQSYARIATSRSAAEQVVERLGIEEPAGAVRSRLGASVEGDSLLIVITADDADRARARALADAAADVFIAIVDDLEAGRVGGIEARLIDSASPPGGPVRPRPGVNLAVGVLLGLAAGVALAVLLDALDRTVKTPQQLTDITGSPVLGVIRRRRDADEIAPLDRPGDSTAEGYRALRTSMRFAASDGDVRTILVTSPEAGDGKSTTVANLAVAFARGGQRVIAVDADLRGPRLAVLLGRRETPGVSSVLVGDSDLAAALQTTQDGVTVLAAGPVPSNPAELVGSQAMADLLADLAGRADVVLIDAPPVLPVTDAVALSTQVDGVLVVTRAGRTRRDRVEAATARLDGVGARILGFVVNGAKASEAAGYGDAYRYTGRRSRLRLGA